MRVDIATEPGDSQRPNEDWASVALPATGHGGALVLLDGVTPPADGDGCVHGVAWFTARLGSALLELSVSRRDMALAQCLAEAIRRTAQAHVSTCDLSHVRTPQATVVVVRWNRDDVEHLVLSDSVLLLEGADGKATAVADDRLDRLPDEVQAKRAAVRSLPRGTPERAAAAAEYALAVEALRNAEGGFFTAAADPGVAGRAVTGRSGRAQVRTVAALTDGAARWSEVFRLGGWDDCVGLLHTEGAQRLIGRVRAAEAADPACTAFPRGKVRDDAAVIFADLTESG
ncbi:hypothetical protein [Streptomyces meridianus]|uniref:Integrase n=1 Tax=Streptomyces meridianus TaxID=2938945 RepID=A0ABT0X0I1_9ACTN|nr:hypothetical protein [Streptomyces meridianus]MCM2576073.1 hypothetical protein [Streptomyces meridianus]